MKDYKKKLISILLVMICIMLVAYAYLARELVITGTTTIGSIWKVEITNIREKEKSIGAYSKLSPSYTATTATFNAGFTSPGDYIIYEVEISNLGTLDAIVKSIETSEPDNQAIKYTISGIKENNKLSANDKKIINIRIDYQQGIKTQPNNVNSQMTMATNFVEYFNGETTTNDTDDIILAQPELIIGDTVTFARSNWRVIKNSNYDDDYVTIIKEKVLNNTEMTSDYLTYEGSQTYARGTAYYWSSTCRSGLKFSGYSGIWYGNSGPYTSSTYTGCKSDYEESQIKRLLEDVYLPTIGEENIKEIDGYKIRLITLDEAISVGKLKKYSNSEYRVTSETPEWIRENMGQRTFYYTMTPYDYKQVWEIRGSTTSTSSSEVVIAAKPTNVCGTAGARPVINLLKSAIE